MTKKLLLMMAALSATLLLLASPAAAGGWANSTLDETPAQLISGSDHQVGFTIRQHGQTPVNPDSGVVGLRLSQPGAAPLTFLATQQGPVGHFVATVNVPTSGTWSWEVLQGWFEPHLLGSIEIVPASGSAAAADSSGSGSSTEWWRIIAVGVAALLAVVFLTDLVAGRRKARRTAPAAP